MIQQFNYQFCGNDYPQLFINHKKETFAIYEELNEVQKENFDFINDYYINVMNCQIHQDDVEDAREIFLECGYKQVFEMQEF